MCVPSGKVANDALLILILIHSCQKKSWLKELVFLAYLDRDTCLPLCTSQFGTIKMPLFIFSSDNACSFI